VYDLQVAQDVVAYQNASKLAGVLQVIVTPKPGVSPMKIDSLVRVEIDKVVREGITARELARVQNSTRSAFLAQLQSAERKADLFNTYNYYVGTPDYVQQDLARYEAVTQKDVQRVAQTYLGKPKVVLTVVPEGQAELMVRRVAP